MARTALLNSYFSRYGNSHKAEITQEIYANASDLCTRVANLLVDIGIRSATLSSGWRPKDVNAKIPNAAKKSLHMIGKAIDLVDNREQDAHKVIAARPDLLEKHGLWLEDAASTHSWFHLDTGTRTARPIRIFKP